MMRSFSQYAVLVAIALLAVLVLSAFQPAPVHAAPLTPATGLAAGDLPILSPRKENRQRQIPSPILSIPSHG